MEKVCGIYRIVCMANGDYYYGSAKNVSYRWARHKNDLRKNKHHNPRVQRVWNKHGENTFRIELIEETSLDQLLIVENTYLKKHIGKPHCMNINSDAIRPTRSDVLRISASLKKYFRLNPASRENLKVLRLNPEDKKKLDDARKLYWSNPENRKKRSELKKAYWSNPENRKKQSDNRKKYWSNPENRKKQSDTTTAFYSNPEYRKKQSDIKKEYYLIPENRKKQQDMKNTYWSNPENRKRQSELKKAYWSNPENRKKQSERKKA